MGWLAKLLCATPKPELQGISLNVCQPFWELEGKTTFPALLRALGRLLPEGSILYFEGGSPDRRLLGFFKQNAIPEQVHIATGTIWPRPDYWHVPATGKNIADLSMLVEPYATPAAAIHFHAYHEGKVLLEWHDAFSQPMLLDGGLPENTVAALAGALGMQFKLNERPVEPGGALDAAAPRQ